MCCWLAGWGNIIGGDVPPGCAEGCVLCALLRLCKVRCSQVGRARESNPSTLRTHMHLVRVAHPAQALLKP